jgi:hypothetical protein
MRKTTLLLLALAVPAFAQTKKPEAPPPAAAEPPRAMVSIYHAAPGKQLDLLKWLAAREAVDKEAGAPATQLYAHVDGDSWDFIVIAPQLPGAAQLELEKKLDAAAKKHGLATGVKAALEFRQYIQTHTDTMTVGPMTAASVVEQAARP